MRNIKTLGQVFTPARVADYMWRLRRNDGRVLDPAAGEGAFYRRGLPMTMIEKDAMLKTPPGTMAMDFFDYPPAEKFDTIIGNPPYVKNRDIDRGTRAKLDGDFFDRHANLYLHFVKKCIDHLNDGGELIFITPRDFAKSSAAARLNRYIYERGTITHFCDFGDEKLFADATPNCAVWRFVQGRTDDRMDDGRRFSCVSGQLYFGAVRGGRLGDIFTVKVGAVSGADEIFRHPSGNIDFVCSETAKTGATRRMIYNRKHRALHPYKERLLARRIRPFGDNNWWRWGRDYPQIAAPRLYVNCKTRRPRPFFRHSALAFDGAVLALFPKKAGMSLDKACERLNNAPWRELGFVCDGRHLFGQRSLENAAMNIFC